VSKQTENLKDPKNRNKKGGEEGKLQLVLNKTAAAGKEISGRDPSSCQEADKQGREKIEGKKGDGLRETKVK